MATIRQQLMLCQDHAPPFIKLLSLLFFSPTLASMAKGIHMSVFIWVYCLRLHLPHIVCSPCHHTILAPPVIMLCLIPLSWCFFGFISPFVIKGKGNTSWCFHTWSFGEGITPNFCLRYSNVSLGRGLVKMSTICSFVSTYSSLMCFFVTCSLRKWKLMGMCFVLKCITGFLDIFIELVLSQNIGMGSSYFTWMSSDVCFI